MEVITLFFQVLFWYGGPLLIVVLIVLLVGNLLRALARKTSADGGRHLKLAISGIAVGTIVALSVGCIPLFDRESGSLDQDWLRGVALISILMFPAFLALIGLRYPGGLLAAGIVSLPMPFMSFSFLLFPMIIPAALYLAAYGEAPSMQKPRLAAPVVSLVAFVLVVGAFFSLFINDDPYCYEVVRRPDGTRVTREFPGATNPVISSEGSVVESGCSSDSVTSKEAAMSLGLLAVGLGASFYLSAPRREGHLQW